MDSNQISHTTKRIAFQIYETFVDEKTVVLAGIASNGYVFAERIAAELTQISDLNIELCQVFIDKNNPSKSISTSIPIANYANKGLVLVDDVLNSGTTMIYAVRHFLEIPLQKFKTAVLVDRNHKKYPVKADFKGISLSTSLQEHVSVSFDDDAVVFLT